MEGWKEGRRREEEREKKDGAEQAGCGDILRLSTLSGFRDLR